MTFTFSRGDEKNRRKNATETACGLQSLKYVLYGLDLYLLYFKFVRIDFHLYWQLENLFLAVFYFLKYRKYWMCFLLTPGPITNRKKKKTSLCKNNFYSLSIRKSRSMMTKHNLHLLPQHTAWQMNSPRQFKWNI